MHRTVRGIKSQEQQYYSKDVCLFKGAAIYFVRRNSDFSEDAGAA
jgi:hypothetical protein